MKKCSKCMTDKPLNAFGKDKNKADGLKYKCKVCHNRDNNEIRRANPTNHRVKNLAYARSERGRFLQRANNLRRKFWPHLTNEQAVAEYDRLLAKQEHKCGICKRPKTEFKVALAVDHCHDTLKVRGLLCNVCNRFEVGRHNLESARALVKYLEEAEASYQKAS